jgi:hypothetical protein
LRLTVLDAVNCATELGTVEDSSAWTALKNWLTPIVAVLALENVGTADELLVVVELFLLSLSTFVVAEVAEEQG